MRRRPAVPVIFEVVLPRERLEMSCCLKSRGSAKASMGCLGRGI